MQLEAAIETMRALWASGHQGSTPATGSRLPGDDQLPATGGADPGHPGRLGRARPCGSPGRLADGINVPSDLDALGARIALARGAATKAGRDPAEVAVTVLDLPVIGTDRDDTWARVERLRGRTAAAAYAQRTHAGTAADQRDRYGALADHGVDTVFVAVADLERAEDLVRLAPLCR